MPKETKVLLKQSSSLKEKSLKNQIGFSSDWYLITIQECSKLCSKKLPSKWQ
jgi:hypothetical protein